MAAITAAAVLDTQGLRYLSPGPVATTVWAHDPAQHLPLLLRLDGKVTAAMRKAQARGDELHAALRDGGSVRYRDGAYRHAVQLHLAAPVLRKVAAAPDRWGPGKPAYVSGVELVSVPFDYREPVTRERVWHEVPDSIPTPVPKPRRYRGRRLVNA